MALHDVVEAFFADAGWPIEPLIAGSLYETSFEGDNGAWGVHAHVYDDAGRGTSVGLTRSSTTFSSMTHLPMSVRDGRSYMTSSSTSSRMARSPRAPVPRSSA